jgi:hypothetical protein
MHLFTQSFGFAAFTRALHSATNEVIDALWTVETKVLV